MVTHQLGVGLDVIVLVLAIELFEGDEEGVLLLLVVARLSNIQQSQHKIKIMHNRMCIAIVICDGAIEGTREK